MRGRKQAYKQLTVIVNHFRLLLMTPHSHAHEGLTVNTHIQARVHTRTTHIHAYTRIQTHMEWKVPSGRERPDGDDNEPLSLSWQ